MITAPRNRDELRAVKGLEKKIHAGDAYVAAREAAIRTAPGIRNDAIRALACHAPAEELDERLPQHQRQRAHQKRPMNDPSGV